MDHQDSAIDSVTIQEQLLIAVSKATSTTLA